MTMISWPTILVFWKEGEDGEPTVAAVTAQIRDLQRFPLTLSQIALNNAHDLPR